jgi:hypothetical protein
MPKYRKKPVVIEAVQLRWNTWNEVCDFVDGKHFGGGVHLDSNADLIGLNINTLEGTMLAEQNDYIIRGVNGEFYPCKPDIFEKTYDPVDADE